MLYCFYLTVGIFLLLSSSYCNIPFGCWTKREENRTNGQLQWGNKIASLNKLWNNIASIKMYRFDIFQYVCVCFVCFMSNLKKYKFYNVMPMLLFFYRYIHIKFIVSFCVWWSVGVLCLCIGAESWVRVNNALMCFFFHLCTMYALVEAMMYQNIL